MTRLDDPVRVVVPRVLAIALAEACTTQMDRHCWSSQNVTAARAVLECDSATVLLNALAERLDRTHASAPGWAVVALPSKLTDDQLRLAAAGVLAGLGTPFYSVPDEDGLWIGRESSEAKDPASFGGTGAQVLHLDAPNVEHVPEYTSLLVMRADPAGGGASLLGDLHTAVAALDQADRDALREQVYFEGRAEGLVGVGAARMPFPVLEEDEGGRPTWVRWAGKMLRDQRNAGRTGPLERFAAALDATTVAVTLGRGQLLIVDQRRVAHGRTALGPQHGVAEGHRRWIVQAKTTFDPSAPVHRRTPAAAGERR